MTSEQPPKGSTLQDSDKAQGDNHHSESSEPEEESSEHGTAIKFSPESTTYQDLYIKGDGDYELRRRSKVAESYEFISHADITSVQESNGKARITVRCHRDLKIHTRSKISCQKF